MRRFLEAFFLLLFVASATTLIGCGEHRANGTVAPDVSVTLDSHGRHSTRLPASIPLPVDFVPEGIATGPGTTFYVGSLTTGAIYRGDLRTGRGRIFVPAVAGRSSVGMKVDERHHLLFVAGGTTGFAYVYDTRSGALVASVRFATGTTLINDVVLTRDAAWFTDSFAPVLYKLPIRSSGRLGTGRTIPLSGPAAEIVPGAPNLNGIAAAPDGKRLIVNHTALGALFTVNPETGVTRRIEVSGLLPGVLDGLLLDDHSLWAVENFANTLVRIRLSSDLSRGRITQTIQSPLFRVPTTVAEAGDDRLALVNARFDLGLPPPLGSGLPPGTEFDVVVVAVH